jgi:hypothetical protein
MKRVVVHIDRLVLKGFRGADAQAIGEGLRSELARALAEPSGAGSLESMGDISRVNAGRVGVGHDAAPRQFGVSAGRAIARGLSR